MSAKQAEGDVKEPLPNRPETLCAVWLDHYGTYTNYITGRLEYGNWGDVAIYAPRQAPDKSRPYYHSVPYGTGVGVWYASVAEIERVFNATFSKYSLDLNGVVMSEWVEPKPKPKTIEGAKMPYYVNNGDKNDSYYAVDPFTGKKRRVPKVEWSRLRMAEGKGFPLPIITITQKEIDAIPNA